LIEAAAGRRESVAAKSFLGNVQDYLGVEEKGTSDPVVLECDDGRMYLVKGRQAGRVTVNEQIVGLLGKALAAPVAAVRVVDIPRKLIKDNPRLQHIPPGPCHGSALLAECMDVEAGESPKASENRARYATLAVLYGWVYANDRQFMCEPKPPHLVYSVDHGHFFYGGPNWTSDGLLSAPSAKPDTAIKKACNLTVPDFEPACGLLGAVEAQVIAEAVAAPPDSWGISLPERVAAAAYLQRRRDELRRWVQERLGKG
jgi:hypothetical protein